MREETADATPEKNFSAVLKSNAQRIKTVQPTCSSTLLSANRLPPAVVICYSRIILSRRERTRRESLDKTLAIA
jgi:hypothetical protein